MQVLFACASAVQQARTTNAKGQAKLDPQGFPESTVLDAAVIRDFQNETLLVVSLVRCLSRTEVGEPLKKYLCAQANAIGHEQYSHDLWALREFLLAEMRSIALPIEDEVAREQVYARAQFTGFLQKHK